MVLERNFKDISSCCQVAVFTPFGFMCCINVNLMNLDFTNNYKLFCAWWSKRLLRFVIRLMVVVCVDFGTGYQANRPFWVHLSGPGRVRSQSVRVLCFPVCKRVPGESKCSKSSILPLTLNAVSLQVFCLYLFDCVCQVDEVMLTLKQAFTTAAALQSSHTQVQLCEACPMHDLHKLCERIEGGQRGRSSPRERPGFGVLHT